MNSRERFFGAGVYSVESVLKGHPDKVCDQVCDAILDGYLELDGSASVAVECLGTGGQLLVAGEVFSDAVVNVEQIAHRVYADIGYADDIVVLPKLRRQSEQLRGAVDAGGAGDQGVMYGYASTDGPNFLPHGVVLVNAIAKEIDELRARTSLFLPDGKVQLGINNRDLDCLVVSVQHPCELDVEELKQVVLSEAVGKLLPLDEIGAVYFNYKSSFHEGGFQADTGVSGRKLVADTYCGLAPHGGGSFSGKDPSKVDRSGAYMARFVAKSIVASGFARWCLVSVAYVFGRDRPIMLDVRTDREGYDPRLLCLIKEKFDFRPLAIRERLDLAKVRYQDTATYGHFFDDKYNWERVCYL